MNDLNRLHYTIFADPANAAAVRTALAIGLVNRAYSEYTTNTGLSTVIPADNTVPQIAEGDQILTGVIVPISANSKIRVRFQGTGSNNTDGGAVIAALFRSGTASAVAAAGQTIHTGGEVEGIVIEHEEAAGSTAARTYSIRVGPGSTGIVHMNGNSGANLFGGVEKCTLVVEEVFIL